MLPDPARRWSRVLAAGVALACLAAVVVSCGNSAESSSRSDGARPLSPCRPGRPGGRTRRRPNLLVIETDDMRWDDLRWMPQRAPADPGTRAQLRELLRAVPPLLPVPVELHERPVRAQPPRLHPPRPLRLHGLPRPAHHLHGAAGGRATTPAWWASTSTGTASSTCARASRRCDYVPPGWDQWYAGSDHLWDYDDPNYGGGHVLLQPPGPEHQRGDPGPSRGATPPTSRPSRRAT